ncbi:MAG: energy-coupling factor transporter transmembrane protein EcfT [Clostridia bacterium]|nr:energy-coupling factor transporter transmembrane protein EcfT [Clostridia bacterium]
MDFSLYGDDSKGVIKLDPRTKLYIFFVSGMLMFNGFDMPLLTVCGTAVFAVLALCGKPWTALKGYAAFCLAIYINLCIARANTGAAVVEMLLQAIITVMLFFLPALYAFILIIQTTRISKFISAFQAMHLPIKLIIPVAVIFRFIPTVQDEWAGIKKAMAFRGISLDIISVIKHPFKTIEYVLIPLLFSSVAVMEEMAAAALARGMDVEIKRTPYEKVKLNTVDYVFIALFTGILAYIFVNGAWRVK